jgi:hypothetical protein
MNDDARSSASPRPPGALDPSQSEAAGQSLSAARDDQLLRRGAVRAQRAAFLDDMIRSIDIMVYCELSVLYYMEWVARHHLRAGHIHDGCVS